MAVDTKRHFLWIYGGANQSCNALTVNVTGSSVTSTSSYYFGSNWAGQAVKIGGTDCGTVSSVADTGHIQLSSANCTQGSTTLQLSAPGNHAPRLDMYYLDLNANPSGWHQVSTTAIPHSSEGGGGMGGSMVYDSDDDVLFAYGYDGYASSTDQWVYCRTAENSTPGTLTAKQIAAGCAKSDDWTEVNHGAPPPKATVMTAMFYDPGTKKVILYGGSTSGGITQNETWAYDIPTRTWTQKCQGGCVPPPPADPAMNIPMPAMVYNSATHHYLFHQVTGAGAPADWEYDPVADTWSKILSAGTPPNGNSQNIAMSYDSVQNKLVGWYQGFSPAQWQGALGAGPTPAGRCDLNSDGVVNQLDVNVAISQALGTSSCNNADLNGDGACNVIDIQRVITAVLGGGCRTGR
jgi:hypothetical protein